MSQLLVEAIQRPNLHEDELVSILGMLRKIDPKAEREIPSGVYEKALKARQPIPIGTSSQ